MEILKCAEKKRRNNNGKNNSVKGGYRKKCGWRKKHFETGKYGEPKIAHHT